MAAFRRYVKRAGRTMASPMFVKIGANDGVTGDPCSDLLMACKAWRGLLIEPVPYCCDRLRQNFSDTDRFVVLEVAIGAETGSRDLFFVRRDAKDSVPDLPEWFDQLGTFDPQHIENHFGPVIRPLIERRAVVVRTYSHVVAEHDLGEYALLHVDTEGYDLEILKMALSHPKLPAMIFIEHKHLARPERQQMRGLLHDHGYHVRECRDDFFALHRGWRS